ncbi:hypothetical protein QJS66_13550 [Kocuria rhizophila]|nr:hypothetical protein QJS66_13550 [Kocuria rhizophila]
MDRGESILSAAGRAPLEAAIALREAAPGGGGHHHRRRPWAQDASGAVKKALQMGGRRVPRGRRRLAGSDVRHPPRRSPPRSSTWARSTAGWTGAHGPGVHGRVDLRDARERRRAPALRARDPRGQRRLGRGEAGSGDSPRERTPPATVAVHTSPRSSRSRTRRTSRATPNFKAIHGREKKPRPAPEPRGDAWRPPPWGATPRPPPCSPPPPGPRARPEPRPRTRARPGSSSADFLAQRRLLLTACAAGRLTAARVSVPGGPSTAPAAGGARRAAPTTFHRVREETPCTSS